jgi:two-component system, NtrC family, nitrogen regulation sensor histidine kinase NtrY
LKILNLFNSRNKILTFLLIFIISWIAIIKLASIYVISDVDKDWKNIESEKELKRKENTLQVFNSLQKDISELSNSLSTNYEIRKQTDKGDIKKICDEIYRNSISADFQLEVYDKWLNLLAFQGNQLEPEYYLLQKAFAGNDFSIIKEIGFSTYLIVFKPIKNFDDENQICGVLLTAKLINVKYQYKNKFSEKTVFSDFMEETYKNTYEIISANPVSGFIQVDSISIKENQVIDLTSTDGKTIGKILIPLFDKSTHINNINHFTDRIISLLVFIFAVLTFFFFILALRNFKNIFIRIFLFGLFIIAIRYLFVFFEFPSKLFESEIFSPSFFASTFGFGIMKSLGELLVSSVFILIFTFFVAKEIYDNIKGIDKNNSNYLIKLFMISSLIALFFYISNLYAIFIQTIIYDSNIKFLDKSDIIPGIGLFFVQLVILIVTLSYLLLSSSLILSIFGELRKFKDIKILRKNYVLLLFVIFLIFNQLVDFFFDNLEIVYFQRILIIVLLFIFCYYVNRPLVLKKNFNLLSIKNFSILLLVCIIISPLILIEKTKSQETKFTELLATELSEQEDDKIVYLITNELTNLAANKNTSENLQDKNKFQKLAFYLWKESKLNYENYNSAIIILDTAKKIVSDFNINSTILSSDSVVNFARKKYFENKLIINVPDSDTSDFNKNTETYDDEEESENGGNMPLMFGNINILKNAERKYFVGIVPIEDNELKNTAYAKTLGYILMVINSEAKNLLPNTSAKIFSNYATDNLTDKLIAKPVITEFLNGEIINSTDAEVSRVLVRSLEPFREFVKTGNNKKYWRYENINNEPYKSFYILAINPASEDNNSPNEKIYVVSLKRDDISLTMFFYLKFILFTVAIYFVFYFIIGLFLLFKVHKIEFNFSEKLFISFLLVSIIPIIFLGIYTRTYITNKNNASIQNQIISDLSLVNESLKDDKILVSKYKSFDSLKRVAKDILDKNFSRTEKNFNFFVKNRLVASTNDELFKSDLIDTRVDNDAFYNIIFLKKDFFIKNKNIGGFDFLVGYKPYKDKSNNIAGIISSISVYKQKEINEELTETLTFIFGSYFIVIIITLIVVSFITQRISKPILELKNATDKLSRGEDNIEIKIKSNDELGSLVESFNKMTKELEKSKNELKKAEREAAWRDIARRVAHEIKNPLTPMKLSIQHLFSIYKDEPNDEFKEVLGKTKVMIVNEIDKLNHIATEFSNFAKLPRRNFEYLNINSILDEVISLYSLEPKVEFVKSLFPNLPEIFGDKQELNRAFQNIIKNAVQSISESGKIEVESYSTNEFVYVKVVDNGCGIEPDILNKLCEPNFSTKSQGMGLGLAITKKTLDDMKATISFDSKLNYGTTVTVKFPVASKQEIDEKK